ncbi:cytochrome c peroxidase [Breoghania sp.]|uniref:cytochrome-c peroxidase n=1 Tax=Breoghania sp. TaxID=2065378 RepID=UPI002AA7FF26|nr:cytochrome c peroxidase [Breoghania sp.]
MPRCPHRFIAAIALATGLFAPAQAQTGPAAPSLREIYERPVSEWPAPTIDEGVEWREMAPLPHPDKKALSEQARSAIALGERLFEDPILSGSGQIACQSCHNSELGWGDGLRTSFGHNRQRGRRNAPAVINGSHRESLFWDGRAATLEDQALLPIINPVEMAADLDEVLDRLIAHEEYPALFADVFEDRAITGDRLASALAAFQRSLERPTRFDRFLEGRRDLLSDRQIRGLHLFRTKARCMTCHHGPTLSDGKFHNLGLTYYGRELEDLGRYEVTGKPEDVGAFATPSLRHVAASAPYMHNGIVRSLRMVAVLYNNGGGKEVPRTPEQKADPLFPKRSEHIRPLNLTGQEISDLVAFLQAL